MLKSFQKSHTKCQNGKNDFKQVIITVIKSKQFFFKNHKNGQKGKQVFKKNIKAVKMVLKSFQTSHNNGHKIEKNVTNLKKFSQKVVFLSKSSNIFIKKKTKKSFQKKRICCQKVQICFKKSRKNGQKNEQVFKKVVFMVKKFDCLLFLIICYYCLLFVSYFLL